MRTVLYSCLAGLSLLLGGCEKKTETMLDQLTVEPRVNPATGVLLRNDGLRAVQLESGNRISGMTRNMAFETANGFRDFTATFTPHEEPLFQQVNGNLFFYAKRWDNGYLFNCSEDYGRQSWNTFAPQIAGGGPDYYRITDFAYQNPTTLLMVATRAEYSSGYDTTQYTAVVYRINPKDRSGAELSSIAGYFAQSICFINEQTGWMVLNKAIRRVNNFYESRNAYVARTTDGGRTWSEPVRVNDENIYHLAAGSEQALFLYTGPTTTYQDNGYFSRDGGRTWQQTNDPTAFYSVDFVDAHTLYALTAGALVKSTDGGENWTTLAEYGPSFYGGNTLQFVNDREGIVYGKDGQVLQATSDGGRTWKLLLYPFRYVVE